MPLYEYRCKACGHRFELIQKFEDPPPKKCPKCGKRRIEKLLSAPAIQFKGTGWYITDYQRKGSSTTMPDHGDSHKDAPKDDKKDDKKETKKDDKKDGGKKGKKG